MFRFLTVSLPYVTEKSLDIYKHEDSVSSALYHVISRDPQMLWDAANSYSDMSRLRLLAIAVRMNRTLSLQKRYSGPVWWSPHYGKDTC